MMPFTLMRLMLAGAALPLTAAAQVPPKGPGPKGPPPAVSIIPKLSEIPDFPPATWPSFDLHFELMSPRFDELRMQLEQVSQFDVQQLKMQADQMKMHVQDLQGLQNLQHLDVAQLSADAKAMAEQVRMDFLLPPGGMGPQFGPGDDLLNARPRPAWADEDPADSLYRTAREALNRGEYRRAAQLFNEVTKKFPKSQYARDCAYWEAFARYRAGTTDDLRQALRILDEGRVQLASLRSDGNVDVQALRARVQGALAARGDQDAARQLEREAAQNSGCDREEVSVRAEALSALGQMDLASAMPVVRKVLARRDECTVELRRRALYLIGRQANGDAVPLILDVAKNDTDPNIRGEAMRWLPRVAGDNAVPQLEELLRNATDEQTQRSAISALGSIDTDRARRAVRAIIERNDAVERVRYDAILSLSRERDGRTASAEDMNYLRSLYGKLESPRLKEAVLASVSRVAIPENEQFLLAIARNENETPSLRATALQRLGRMSTVGLNDIAKLYDVADSRSLREQILSALNQRKEPEAVDKMMEIARRDTDPQIRRYAIALLARRNDPRATKLLQELLDK